MQSEAVIPKVSCLVLYGNTVFLAGIRAELEHLGSLELITVETGAPYVIDLIRARQPRALLFDLTIPQPDFAIQLLRDQPGLLLIGADPSSNELLILSGCSQPALSVSDLIAVIDQDQNHAAPCRQEDQALILGQAKNISNES